MRPWCWPIIKKKEHQTNQNIKKILIRKMRKPTQTIVGSIGKIFRL